MECLSCTFPTMIMYTIPTSLTAHICAIRPVQTTSLHNKQLSSQALKNHKIQDTEDETVFLST